MSAGNAPAPPHRAAEQEPEVAARTAAPLWSAALPAATTGALAVDQFGGCLVSTFTTLSAYGHHGRRLWDTAVGSRTAESPLVASDGALFRLEGSLIVARGLETGAVVRHFAAPDGNNLTLTPWGDLLYIEYRPSRTALMHCVSRTGRHRWSRYLDARVTPPRPFPLADLVVTMRHGALWGLDQTGSARWVAGPAGIYPPPPTDDGRGAPSDELTINSPPVHLDSVRALISLRWPGGSGLFLLDASAPQITPVVEARPLRAPFTALPAPTGGYRITVNTGPTGTVPAQPLGWEWARPQAPGEEWARPEKPAARGFDVPGRPPLPAIIAIDPGGATAWEHPPAGTVTALVAAGPDRLVLATQTGGVAWLECLADDGTVQWRWQAPGPLTHHPVAGHGIVYAGSAGALWALAVRPATSRPG